MRPDVCDIRDGLEEDCHSERPGEPGYRSPDSCDIAEGTSADVIPPGGNGVPDECDVTCALVSCDPPNCAVDSRQPHDLNDAGIVFGWQDSIELTLNCPTAGMTDANFGVSSGTITNVTTDGMTATLELADPITSGEWTCFWLVGDEANQLCLGYLPGDADGDLTTAPADILAVIDHLNGVVPRPDYAVDMDRDGTVAPADILRVIDLLNGAGQFISWNGSTLPACPSE